MSHLVVPIYSMRSYDTGKYSILKDGNFKLHINRMDWDNDFLVVPDNCSDLEEFKSLNIISKDRIIEAKYGINAYETRGTFWENNTKQLDQIATHFNFTIVTDLPLYNGKNKFINNFNITKDPNNPRWYIDQFINDDIIAVNNAEKTYVLNQSQKDYLEECGAKGEIEVSTKVVSKKYFDKVGIEEVELPDFDIFFPFRLSDPAYKFEEVLKLKEKILITDPNDSWKEENNNGNIIKKRFTKRQYYGIIYRKPKVLYNEDPDKIFHPGLADFIYFGCDIESPHKIPTLKDVLIENKNYFY